MHNSRFYEKLSRYNKDVILDKYLEKGTITKDDHKLINSFLSETSSRKQTGQHRIISIASKLCNWRKFVQVEYGKANIQDLYDGIDRIKNGTYTKIITTKAGVKEIERPFKQNSLHDYVLTLRQFFKWMAENNKTEIPEKKIRNIKLPSRDYDTTLPEELPSQDEVSLIIKSCQKSMHAAFMAVLYDAGCRIGELCRITWRDVVFEKIGDTLTAKLYIDDVKTKKRRYSRLTMATGYLAEYKNDYEAKYGAVNPNDFVFVGRDKMPFTYAGAVQVFERMVKRAKELYKIDKHITPHDFRRARATHMIQQNYQESIIKKTLWGNLNTPQFQVYARLSDEDIDSELLSKTGIQAFKKERVKPLGPRPCGECGFVNDPTDNFCRKCGFALMEKVKVELKTAINKAEELPEYQRLKEDYDAKFKALYEQIEALTKSKS
jgi:integrase